MGSDNEKNMDVEDTLWNEIASRMWGCKKGSTIILFHIKHDL